MKSNAERRVEIAKRKARRSVAQPPREGEDLIREMMRQIQRQKGAK